MQKSPGARAGAAPGCLVEPDTFQHVAKFEHGDAQVQRHAAGVLFGCRAGFYVRWKLFLLIGDCRRRYQELRLTVVPGAMETSAEGWMVLVPLTKYAWPGLLK